MALGRYPSLAAARSTAARRGTLTWRAPRMTRETRDFETPAWRATSSMVGLPRLLSKTT